MRVMTAFLDWLANHKGTPILIGIALILLNFLVVLVAAGGWFARTNALLHAGLVVSLLGGLLSDVL